MVHTWRRAFALTLLMIAPAAAGCGTSVAQHDTRYQQQLQSVQQGFEANVADIVRSVSRRVAPAATADAVGRFEAALARVDLSLRATRAPATVSRLHRH